MEIHHRELFCLKREKFTNNFSAELFDFFTESKYHDVTLVSDEQVPFKAHKFVLSACSPVMKSLLMNNPHPHPIIYLGGLGHLELKSVLQFMYLGEIKFYKGKRSKLLEAAKNLQLKQLEEAIVPKKSSHEIRERNFHKFSEQKHYENSEDPSLDNDKKSKFENIKLAGEKLDHNDSSNSSMTKQSFSCRRCLSQFNCDTALWQHIKSKHEGIMFSCQHCKYSSDRKASIKMHQEAEHQDINYSCHMCGFKAKDRSMLKKHLQNFHDEETENTYYAEENRLVDNVAILSDECDAVEKKVEQDSDSIEKEIVNENLKDAIYESDQGYKKQFWCQVCSALFNSNAQLWHHIRSVHEGLVFSCPFCEYKSDRKHSVERHQKSMHKDMEYKYSCYLCAYTSKDKGSLKVHLKDNHPGKPIACDLCKYQSKDIGQLKMHKQIVHGGIRFSCNKCGHLSSNINSLQKHMQDIH